MAGESAINSRPAFTEEEILIAASKFGDFVFVKKLPSERDQNLLLQRKGGTEADMVVFKVHNPSDSADFVECQNQALELAASNGCSCQRLLSTLEGGEKIVELSTTAGGVCLCRMLTFLPGGMLAEVAPSWPDQANLWSEVGKAVGSVTKALQDLNHSAAHIIGFDWDLQRCEEVITQKSTCLPEQRQAMIAKFLREYQSDVKPLLSKLRKSVVHNDGNDYNIVVDRNSGQVGLLDFGDMLYSYTCADAAICMAYLLFHVPAEKSLVSSMVPFVRSFYEQCPLTAEELQVVFGLAIVRVCTSVCMSAFQSSLEPDNEYLLISAGPAWALLERLERESGADTEKPGDVFLRACMGKS